MKTKIITMKEYCPNSPYGYDMNQILKKVVNREAEAMIPDAPRETPKYQRIKQSVEWKAGMKNLVRSIML